MQYTNSRPLSEEFRRLDIVLKPSASIPATTFFFRQSIPHLGTEPEIPQRALQDSLAPWQQWRTSTATQRPP